MDIKDLIKDSLNKLDEERKSKEVAKKKNSFNAKIYLDSLIQNIRFAKTFAQALNIEESEVRGYAIILIAQSKANNSENIRTIKDIKQINVIPIDWSMSLDNIALSVQIVQNKNRYIGLFVPITENPYIFKVYDAGLTEIQIKEKIRKDITDEFLGG